MTDKVLGHATAYGYYKAGGGTMTEAEFTEFMADFGTASQTAVEAAQAALASETAARTAATTATNKATEATTAAQTATTKAAEAQADADAAALDASQALSAASTATTKATEATTAAATATSAATTATTAKDDAVSAKTAAQTAQTGAETAAASVQSSAEQIATNTEDIAQLKSELTHFTGINLFDESKAVDGYLQTNGSIAVLNDWKTTDYIPVSGLSAVIASSVANTNGTRNFNPMYFLHSYDANKTHKGKVWESSGNGIYTIGEGVAYIRFSYHNYSFGVDLMVEAGTVFHLYRPYKEFNALSKGTYKDEHQLVQDESGLNIVCWGDSLTYSQYNTDITYPSKLSELIQNSNEVVNLGIPGEKAMAIACRQGAFPVMLAPVTIASSGVTEISITDIFGNGFTTLMHNPIRYHQLKSVGDTDVFGKSIKLAYSSSKYVASLVGSGNDAITTTRPTALTLYGKNYRNYIPIIWAGTNDAPATAEDAEHVKKIIRTMVDYSHREEYLVLGLTVKSYADAVNNVLAYEFGSHYVDVLGYLLTYGLSDNNITPTSQDETDISNGIVPTSLRYDSVHFNDYGYNAVANCVYNHGKNLGYWE